MNANPDYHDAKAAEPEPLNVAFDEGTYKGSLTDVGNLYHSTFTYPRILDIPGFSTFKRGVFTPGFGCRN